MYVMYALPVERFIAKLGPVKWAENACWEWTTAVDPSGYGRFHDGTRMDYAHRFAHEAFVGPIPEGFTIDHLCRNRACVRPSHLEAVPHSVNCLRGHQARRRDVEDLLTPASTEPEAVNE